MLQKSIHKLTDDEAEALKYDWKFLARDNQLTPLGDWYVWMIRAGRGFGKALATDTPIITPSGWTTMGDLCQGDEVFDESGLPCQVTGVYPQGLCDGWQVNFSDGASLIANDEHEWITLDAKERKRRNGRKLGVDGWQYGKPITTQEIRRTVVYGGRSDRNHAIPLTSPLRFGYKDLLIDPYFLGLWIGDGSKKSGSLAYHKDDTKYYEKIFAKAGEGNITSRLKSLGLVNNKHIPDIYLKASIDQRVGLLRGLMDSDGSISDGGHCEFCNVNEHIAKSVVELLLGLGERPSLYEERATIYGRDVGSKYRVCWRPKILPFSLPRKVARYRPLGNQAMRSQHRMIVSVEPVNSCDMVCISVSSKSRLFLAGRGLVPTHNTRDGC